jgi:hypothetical protein
MTTTQIKEGIITKKSIISGRYIGLYNLIPLIPNSWSGTYHDFLTSDKIGTPDMRITAIVNSKEIPESLVWRILANLILFLDECEEMNDSYALYPLARSCLLCGSDAVIGFPIVSMEAINTGHFLKNNEDVLNGLVSISDHKIVELIENIPSQSPNEICCALWSIIREKFEEDDRRHILIDYMDEALAYQTPVTIH